MRGISILQDFLISPNNQIELILWPTQGAIQRIITDIDISSAVHLGPVFGSVPPSIGWADKNLKVTFFFF
jgi:hypothetical protein